MKNCMYCDAKVKEEDMHFACPICGNGMCQECYDRDIGTDKQYHDIDDSVDDDQLYYHLKEKANGMTNCICDDCVEEAIQAIKN